VFFSGFSHCGREGDIKYRFGISQVGEENAGHLIQFRETHILEWNVTESGNLPDVRVAQDAWQQNQVGAELATSQTLDRPVKLLDCQ
jgi:Cu/Zn superoxide dismutase